MTQRADCQAMINSVGTNSMLPPFSLENMRTVFNYILTRMSVIDEASAAIDAMASSVAAAMSGLVNTTTMNTAISTAIATLTTSINTTLGNKQDKITPQSASTNLATPAVTTLPDNYNLVSGLLGVADGLNNANRAQNSLEIRVLSMSTAINNLYIWMRAQGLKAT